MTELIVDSSAWIDFFNAPSDSLESSALAVLLDKDARILMLPVIYQEIMQGIRDDVVFSELRRILGDFPRSDVGVWTASDIAVDLYRSLRKKGVTIRAPNDCLIAAYCIIHKVPLLHRDQDFALIAANSKLKLYKLG